MGSGVEANDSMMLVGDPAWHKLFDPIKSAPKSSEEALVASGLTWNVDMRPQLYYGEGNIPKASPDRILVRSDDESILSTVGPDYVVVQNEDAFKFFDPFVQDGHATFETAGSLNGGKRVFILAKISQDPITIVKGDEILPYILLSNAYLRNTAVTVGFTSVRVVCQNTLDMATRSKASKLLRAPHNTNVHNTLEKIRDTMDLVRREFSATAEQYRVLAAREVNVSDLKKYVKIVFTSNLHDSSDINEVLISELTKYLKSTKLVEECPLQAILTGRLTML
jgi:phage/plasmid-like protein (TIGR03299 family)